MNPNNLKNLLLAHVTEGEHKMHFHSYATVLYILITSRENVYISR